MQRLDFFREVGEQNCDRVMLSFPTDMDKKSTESIATEDNIVPSKYETLKSMVKQLGHEVTTLENKKSIRAASIVAASSGVDTAPSIMRNLVQRVVFAVSCVTERVGGVGCEEHPRKWESPRTKPGIKNDYCAEGNSYTINCFKPQKCKCKCN